MLSCRHLVHFAAPLAALGCRQPVMSPLSFKATQGLTNTRKARIVLHIGGLSSELNGTMEFIHAAHGRSHIADSVRVGKII